MDHVAEVAARLGDGVLLAKVDIESAYQLIPVHPEDRPLQAVQWREQILCCLSASVLPQKSLMLLPTPYTGTLC